MEPAPDRRPEQARDVRPGQEAADDGQSELHPADRRIEQPIGRRAEVALVEEQVAEPAADDGAGHDPDRDERDVVRAEAAAPGQEAGQHERGDDDPGQGDRPPADGQVAEQVGVGVELEGQDGDRHGGDECIEGGPRYHATMTGLRIALLAAVWMVGGCSAAGSGGGKDPLRPSSRDPPPIPDETAAASSSPGAIDLPASVIEPVVAEISRISGVPVADVAIVSAEAVTFSDGSLGCPVPGMAYTQMVTDGYRIVANAGGGTYDYRGPGNSFSRCLNPKAAPSPS